MFSSDVIGLFPKALSSLTTEANKMGVRMGMIFSMLSCAVLIGSPISGALISAMGSIFLSMEVFIATIMLYGLLILLAERLSKSGMKLMSNI